MCRLVDEPVAAGDEYPGRESRDHHRERTRSAGGGGVLHGAGLSRERRSGPITLWPKVWQRCPIGWPNAESAGFCALANRIGSCQKIVKQCGGAIVVTDFDPLAPGRAWRKKVADRIPVSLVTVDSDTVVPSSLFQKEEWAPRTIRPKINRVLAEYLQPIPNPVANRRSAICEAHDPLAVVRTLPLDQTVGPSSRFRGGSDEAQARLRTFLTKRLPDYADGRNKADIDGTSELSPYLHFGQISPLEVALQVVDSDAPQESIDAFINEMVIQRELAINFALRNPDYDQFSGLPDWGRKTLTRSCC